MSIMMGMRFECKLFSFSLERKFVTIVMPDAEQDHDVMHLSPRTASPFIVYHRIPSAPKRLEPQNDEHNSTRPSIVSHSPCLPTLPA